MRETTIKDVNGNVIHYGQLIDYIWWDYGPYEREWHYKAKIRRRNTGDVFEFVEDPNGKPCHFFRKLSSLNWSESDLAIIEMQKQIIYRSGRNVLQFDLQGNFIKRWERIIDAAKSVGATSTTMVLCCRNHPNFPQLRGYIWIYPEDIDTISDRVKALPKYHVENLPNEEWRDVIGYEGLYQVSNKGRIKSLYARNKWGLKREAILSPGIDKLGYSRYNLNKNGKGRTEKLHRMVAMAFLPNPENKPLIDHIDGNPSNNCVENLRWATYLENKYNPNTRNRHLIPVLQFSKDGEFIKEWTSAQEASLFFGIGYASIQTCCRGNSKTSMGYIWKYKKSV